MFRKLMTTTALAMLLTTAAAAQNATPATPPATTADPAMSQGLNDMLARGYQATDSDYLATNIIGAKVYTSVADDADEIGEINNLVLAQDGSIGAAIIGVGGFLGIGEKNIAVDYSALMWDEATERFTLDTTADQLASAPDFVWEDDRPMDTQTAAAPGQPAVTDPNMAPANPNAAAPADNMAATPVNPNATAMDPALDTATETAANPNDRPMGPMDPTTMEPVPFEALTADNLIGTQVIGPENEVIAEVGDILLTQDGNIDALLVDFGGFLGIGQKRVAVGVDNLEFSTDENGFQYVWLNVTREQLEAAQAYDEATWQETRDQQRLAANPA